MERENGSGRLAIEIEEGTCADITEALACYKPSGRGLQQLLHGPLRLQVPIIAYRHFLNVLHYSKSTRSSRRSYVLIVLDGGCSPTKRR